ncbi:MAG: cell division protein SepF [Nanoarchaeota archaeon]|nr:cell division protein SepF [Nanoarchaeota archaeon]
MAGFFSKLGGKRETYVEDTQDEYLALNESEIIVNNPKREYDVEVQVFVLDDYEHIRKILDTIRSETTMCLIDIHLLRNKDPDELKKAIDKLKKTVEAVSGELIGFHENWIMAIPKNVKVRRNK